MCTQKRPFKLSTYALMHGSPVCTWLPEITYVLDIGMYVCVCVCVCVRVPVCTEALIVDALIANTNRYCIHQTHTFHKE